MSKNILRDGTGIQLLLQNFQRVLINTKGVSLSIGMKWVKLDWQMSNVYKQYIEIRKMSLHHTLQISKLSRGL